MRNESLPLFAAPKEILPPRPARRDARAIEDPGFPFERLSEIAELESWRK